MKHFRILKGAASTIADIQPKQDLKSDMINESARLFSRLKHGTIACEQDFIDKLTAINSVLTSDDSKDIAKRIEREILEKNFSSIDSQGPLELTIITGLL